MSTTTPTPKALSVALSLIDRNRWRLAGQVLDVVRAQTVDDPDQPKGAPVYLGGMALAEWFGSPRNSRNHLTKAITDLIESRVLIEVEEARGSVGRGVVISGRFDQWRVPWRVEKELALRRIADVSAGPHAAQTPFSAALYDAAQSPFARRSMTPRKPPPNRFSAASWNAAQQFPQRGVMESRANSAPSPFVGVSRDFVSLGSEGESHLRKVVAKVCELARVPELFGRPEAQMRALVAEVGDSTPLLELLEQSPPGLGVKKLPDWLCLEWEKRRPDPHARLELLHRRRQSLLGQSVTWEDGDEWAEQQRADLADVERQIAEVEAL